GTLRVWEVDLLNRKMRPTECQMGQLKRVVTCLARFYIESLIMKIGLVAENDSCFYCGTSTGDILKMNTKTKLLNSCGPQKGRFSLPCTHERNVRQKKSGGSFSSSIPIVRMPHWTLFFENSDGPRNGTCSKYFRRRVQLQGAITSITLRGQGHQFFVGTSQAQIYRFNYPEFKEELVATCHSEAINDIVFPFGTSELFATCAKNDIRVWHTTSHKELLRITIPNMTCNAIEFTRDGKSILSAWNDGKIRAFTPESGRLMYQIENAHSMGVTAIAVTSDCKRIVSGGGEGQVRVWEIGRESQRLVESMKEHKSAVTCIKLKGNNRECVTASSDGACIIWDLVRFIRKQMILSNTLFRCVCYHPEEFQIITSGTDRKIIRNFGEIRIPAEGLQISAFPASFQSEQKIPLSSLLFSLPGGDDKLVKVWDYNEGEATQVGIGHSGSISRIKICPLSKYIISVSNDGAILRWKYPYPV
ncbi:hypothetical protein AB205_0206300, partial [Aquarana catesbeiana]